MLVMRIEFQQNKATDIDWITDREWIEM